MQGTASALTNSCTTNDAGTIITIKQESLSNVDNLVGSFVDSTTFLPSPNSQISNAQMAQNSLTNDSNGINEGMNSKFLNYLTDFFLTNFHIFQLQALMPTNIPK